MCTCSDDLKSSVVELSKQVKQLNQKVDSFDSIKIINGGKRLITFRSNEFHQMLFENSNEFRASVTEIKDLIKKLDEKQRNSIKIHLWKLAEAALTGGAVVALFQLLK